MSTHKIKQVYLLKYNLHKRIFVQFNTFYIIILQYIERYKNISNQLYCLCLNCKLYIYHLTKKFL